MKLTKEEFLKWAEENHWLKTNENPNTNGRLDIYMTPAGNCAAAIYDIKGELQQVQPVVLIPPPPPTKFPGKFPGLMELRGP
jgi:hypothetical protein